jgi:hypothetical protein
MQILIMIWEPNKKWLALNQEEQQDYLLSLDLAVNEARSHGVMTLGWSAIDRTLPKAPNEGFVGIFAMSSAEQIHQLESNIQTSKWYDYFDSTNVSICPEGGTNPIPSEEYARILAMRLG